MWFDNIYFSYCFQDTTFSLVKKKKGFCMSLEKQHLSVSVSREKARDTWSLRLLTK